MKYIILLNILALMSCERVIEDTEKAELIIHDIEVMEKQIAADAGIKVYTMEKGQV